jgi:predicted 2-oxoglutarate/Fe(II)-dependent dioxygenase YbiX
MIETDTHAIVHRWEHVLSPKQCAQFIAAMNAAPTKPGMVLRDGRETLALDTRVCLEHDVSSETRTALLARVSPLLDEVLESFGLASGLTNGPYFVSYGVGAFFRLHQDTGHHAGEPKVVADRLLSLVLYLNGRETTGKVPAFDGGALAVYDPDLPGAAGRQIIVPQQGMLVAFRSDSFHEVLTIHEGIRYAVLLWLLKR